MPKKLQSLRGLTTANPEVAAARLTERLSAPLIEGRRTADLVRETLPKVQMRGTEKLSDILAATEAKSEAINEAEANLLSRPLGNTTVGETRVGAQSVADALRNQIDDNMRRFDPKLVEAIEEEALKYEQGPSMTIKDLQKRLRTLNNRAKAIYQKPEVEAALAQQDPKVQFLKVQTDAVRDAYYDALERATGESFRDTKKLQSELISMQKLLYKPAAKEAMTAEQAVAHKVLGPKGSLRRRALGKVAGAAATGAGLGAGYEIFRPSK